ncbi:MAG: hypothetical protein EZS28_012183 [Streblomastix strix]|uniref:Uncharacterized protein n=1 Tax=Streblomastix strix TaxID=222440 RepID=A0A5J4WBL4_9EUKA|nr:MAG: hypothetical protein EZS28_012183 [Streblomastix strix]
MMGNMMNKLHGRSNDDQAMKIHINISMKLSEDEYTSFRTGSGSDIRLTSFIQFQILRQLEMDANRIIYIGMGKYFDSSIEEQEIEFKNDSQWNNNAGYGNIQISDQSERIRKTIGGNIKVIANTKISTYKHFVNITISCRTVTLEHGLVRKLIYDRRGGLLVSLT